jgi:hypothetical protein
MLADKETFTRSFAQQAYTRSISMELPELEQFEATTNSVLILAKQYIHVLDLRTQLIQLGIRKSKLVSNLRDT